MENNLLEKPTILSFMCEFDREFIRLLKTAMRQRGHRKINQVSVISFIIIIVEANNDFR